MILSVSEVKQLLAAMEKHNRAAEVDWTNRRIMVLSEVKTHPTKRVSSGPLTYQDYLFTIEDK